MTEVVITMPDLLRKKRNGDELTAKELAWFTHGVCNDEVQDCQIGAMLMAMYLKGMSNEETVHLTTGMVQSGDILTWDSKWTLVDKHSTGGVGDKVSLPLAPALASLGLKVPMVSGRGLEFTGGTLDKLESIPGFKVQCSYEELHQALEVAGCFIAGPTGSLAPADKELYKRRDVTATVDSTPLIVASIISKKVAEGTKTLVMDIKVGQAAFYKNVEDARILANQMIEVSRGLGVATKAALTSMDTPIGCYVGNALEVAESIDCLTGKGPADLVELVATTGGLILQMQNMANSLDEGKALVTEVLSNGKALHCFRDMLVCQGVVESTADDLCFGDMWSVLPTVPSDQVTKLTAKKTGVVSSVLAMPIAIACWKLGAGRSIADQPIDYRVGVHLLKVEGSIVTTGDPWIEVHHATPQLDSNIKQQLEDALIITENANESKQMTRIIEII